MKKNAIVFAALTIMLSGSLVFPTISSAAKAVNHTTESTSTNTVSGEETASTDETVDQEGSYEDLDPELAAIHQKLARGSYLQLEDMMLYKKAVSNTKINWSVYYQSNAKNAAGKKLLEQAETELYQYESRFED
jgi:hypothetical protein